MLRPTDGRFADPVNGLDHDVILAFEKLRCCPIVKGAATREVVRYDENSRTGGAGFIGGHAWKLLARRGFEPIALDNLSSGKPLSGEEARWNWAISPMQRVCAPS